MTHELKILPKWFNDVAAGVKNFEVRRNDRPFAVGDKLLLKEWERGKYTGREIMKEIIYIYQGYGTFTVCDRGGMGNNVIDIYLGGAQECIEFGRRTAEVYYG